MPVRRRRTTIAALAAVTAAAALAFACGIDAVATRDVPGPDANDDHIVVLPETGPIPDANPGMDVAVDAAEAGCPTGHGTMVEVHDAGGLTFCIDSTEVTNAEFQKFVSATSGSDAGFDAGEVDGCAPGPYSFVPFGTGDFPAANLTWCSAHAYCAWSGKRMCGKVDPADASSGEWYAACSNGNTRIYPYGSMAQPGACDDNTAATTATMSHPQCEGGVPGIYDMVGNVAELTDNCQGPTCNASGGFYLGGGTCATIDAIGREAAADFVGFRCCSDL